MKDKKQSLLKDISLAKIIICTMDQYHSFVRNAIQEEMTRESAQGDPNRCNLLDAEMNRLDDLYGHTPFSMA